MNGLELSRGYYGEYGKPMLENEFARLLPYLAVGFVGSGSEHYGFDDEISRDHDFEPGFCIFLPDEETVSRRDAFLLERAYAKLPREYGGVKCEKISPVGGNRNGVIRTSDFYSSAVGAPDGGLSTDAWLRIPDYALAEAVNGEIFYDGYGEFTKIRRKLMNMPEDVKLKRLAGNLLIMAQSGQYNFPRCLKHGEPEAAQLACVEFVNSAMKAVSLLNNKYLPYYKWSFRALRENAETKEISEKLSVLLFGENSDIAAKEKYDIIEEISAEVISKLQSRDLTKATCDNLENHAYSVNDKISDSYVRNLHILSAV